MKIFKKVFMTVVLVITVLCAGYIVSANDFKMRIDTVTIPEGYDGDVIVPVYLDSMPDGMELSCFAWEFYFDHESISFVPSKDPSAFTSDLIVDPDSDCIIGKIAKIDGSEGKFRFGFTTIDNYITETGVVLNLPFQVRGDLAPGRYNIVADSFSDIFWGPASIISEDYIMADINKYLEFGAIVVTGEGEEEYNDYDAVSSRAKFPTFVMPEDSYVSGVVGEEGSSSSDVSYSSNSSSSGGQGTISSSTYQGLPNDYMQDAVTVSDTVEAGTMVTFNGGLVHFDTIKSRSGWLVCALYAGETLVGYDISPITERQRTTTNVTYSELPDMAVTVVMLEDGTFDCYGKYPVKKAEK